MKVIAPYTEGWGDYLSVEARIVRNTPSSWEVMVGGYSDLASLINNINALLAIDPDHPCLETLEIHAHGNPINIDAFWRTDAATLAQQLMTLNWCDEANIYLAGCNTGLPRSTALRNPARVGPIAKLLADLMPFDATKFPHKIWIYGSKGYLYNTKAEGNEKTIDTFTERSWAWSIPPWTTTVWKKYPGGTDASGAACWNGFKNGTW